MGRNNLIIISDLHLSARINPSSGNYEANDGFRDERAFENFAKDLIGRLQKSGGEWRLLILGDLLDFMHTRIDKDLPKNYVPETTKEISLIKLEAIFIAHQSFFKTLSQLMAAGVTVDILPGNHDIEFMRPSVQVLFKQFLSQRYHLEGLVEKINFYPWIYLVPGVLYAEHGQQYHDINAFTTLLDPFIDKDKQEIELTVGAHWDRFLYHLLERHAPEYEPANSPLRFLKHPQSLFKALPDIVLFGWNCVRQVTYRISPKFYKQRTKYREKILASYSTVAGLDFEIISAIDRLSALSSIALIFRLVGKIFRNSNKSNSTPNYIYPKAKAIHQVLISKHQGVHYYIFGHSHQTWKVPFEPGETSAYFINTGAWSSPEYSRKPGERTNFPFVHITWQDDNQSPRILIQQWNEITQRSEPVSS